MTVLGYWRIIRPVNSIVAGLAAALAYLLATGTIIPEVILLIAIVFLITSAGNTINDFFDQIIDSVNRPERPIPSGTVSKNGAVVFACLLFIVGIVLSLFTNPLCVFFAVFNSLLLLLYAKTLKSTPFFGNIAVAYLAGSIFLFGGAFAGLQGLINNIIITLITFFAMLARELLKDAEDVPGDLVSGAKTVPILFGVHMTVVISAIFTIIAVIVSFYPYLHWGAWYLAGIIPVDIIILSTAFRSSRCNSPECIKNSNATNYLKYGMFTSLVVFTLAAVFLG
jgi:geranylgeranylglycerol-phosphate geranylgeranyltransferase